MAKKDDAAGDAPGGKKKGKNNLVPAIVVAVGLLGAAYFMSSGGKAKSAAATPAAAAGADGAAAAGAGAGTTPTTVAGGEVATTGDAITLNLADGRFLKVGLALQLAKGGKADAWTTAQAAKALDAAISYFGSKTYGDLSAPGGRDAAKADLSKKVAALYPNKVLGVYFTQFVMQ